MVSYRLVAAAGLVASVYALPLNINLGAYSPALVVGDGEISFGGGADVSALFNTLEGAAQTAAAGQTAGAAQAAAPAAAPAAAAAVVAAPVVAASSSTTPTVATPIVAASSGLDPALSEQAASITTLQGMGKEISPRDDATNTESSKAKRDLAGFDRALTFAEAALTKGPVVQLGTGAKGAGVGIVVDNRPSTAAAAAVAAPAAAAPAAAAKRDEAAVSQPRLRTRVTTMYIRRGVPLALQKLSEVETRDIKSVPVVAIPMAKEKREVGDQKRDTSSTTIDAINLNVDDPHGITMTFVETSEDEE